MSCVPGATAAAPFNDLAGAKIVAERLIGGEDNNLTREHVFRLEQQLADAADRYRKVDAAGFREIAGGSRDIPYKRLYLRLAQLAILESAPGAAIHYLDIDATQVAPNDRDTGLRLRAAALVLDGRTREAKQVLRSIISAKPAPCFGSSSCPGGGESLTCSGLQGDGSWAAVMAAVGPRGPCAANSLIAAAENFRTAERDDLAENFLMAAMFAVDPDEPGSNLHAAYWIKAAGKLLDLLADSGRRNEARALLMKMDRVSKVYRVGEVEMIMGRQSAEMMDGKTFPANMRLQVANHMLGQLDSSGFPPWLTPAKTRHQIMRQYREKARAEFALGDFPAALVSSSEALRYSMGSEDVGWPLRMDFGPYGPECPRNRPDFDAACRKWIEDSISLAASVRVSELFADRALIEEASGNASEALLMTRYSLTVLENWMRQNWSTATAVSNVLSGRQPIDQKILAMLSRIHMRNGVFKPEAANLAFSIAQLLQNNPNDAILRAAIVRGAIADNAVRMAIQAREALAEQRRVARVNEPAKVESLSAQIDALDRSLPTPLSTFERKTSFSTVGIKDAQALLSRNEAIVLILTLMDRSEVMLVTNESFTWRTSHQPDAWFRGRAQALAAYLRAPGGGQGSYDRKSAYELYRELLAPFALQLADRLLLTSVSGALSQLPLGVLVTQASGVVGGWLAQTHGLMITPSVASLRAVRTAPRTPRRDALIAIGDPHIDSALSADGPNLKSLRFAGEEISRLRTVAGSGPLMVLTGPRATRAAVTTANLSSVRVLEFATHAIQPGDSATIDETALVLSPPHEGAAARESYLTSSDVSGLRIGADIVLLSACETANGSLADESISGLAQAFLFAGARGVVATRWRVADEAALNLVGDGFAAPLDGSPGNFAEGLRRRIDALVRQQAVSIKSDPRYWGAFVVVGG
jgi:CHAT domain-containing protein